MFSKIWLSKFSNSKSELTNNTKLNTILKLSKFQYLGKKLTVVLVCWYGSLSLHLWFSEFLTENRNRVLYSTVLHRV